MLGAAGVNMGSRFLAAVESPVTEGYRDAILQANSQDTMKFEGLNELLPFGKQGYGTVLRTITTPWTERLNADIEATSRDSEALLGELIKAGAEGKMHEVMPSAGQSSGGIREVLPAAEIVRRIVEEAQAALAGAR
jgi:nitronate monooxygenase/enoyl-[acyl-carrier protein] reductase II